ncbi:hypothetical protein GQT55_000393 [Salmonella enterica]|nr:hypothetical protein [Salmonella enterica]
MRREEKFRIHKYKIFIIYILLIVSVDVYLRIAVIILSMGQILCRLRTFLKIMQIFLNKK